MTGLAGSVAAALAAVALLAGCRAGGTAAGVGLEAGGVATAASPSPSPSPETGRLLVGLGAETPSGEPATTFRGGQPVTLVLVVLNRSPRAARLTFPSGQSYDFWVTRDGREVWRWSAGRMFTQALREEELAAGERREFRETWSRVDAAGQPVPPGAYEARGLLAVGGPGLPTPPLAVRLER